MINTPHRRYRLILIGLMFTSLIFKNLIFATLSQAQAPLQRKVTAAGFVEYSEDDRQYQKEEIAQAFFIGGDPGKGKRHLLRALFQTAKQYGRKASVVFAGDLIYSHGLVTENSPDRLQAENRINVLLEESKRAGVATALVPGNHDWNNSKEQGWDAVVRLNEYVENSLSEPRVFPSKGCPGPSVISQSEKSTLIALDTQWWLHEHERPKDTSDECSGGTGLSALERLDKLLAQNSGKHQIVVSHHPFRSFGPHGDKKPSWNFSRCRQGQSCPTYRSMLSKLEPVLERHKPLICASGHEHSLQITRLDLGCKYQLVSGSMSHLTNTHKGKGSIYAKSALGFMQVDLLLDTRVFVTVFTISSNGEALSDFVYQLQ